MSPDKSNTQKPLKLIMLAVFVWGVLLAIGVLVVRNSWLGASIVLGCTLGFLGIWMLLLWRRARGTRAS